MEASKKVRKSRERKEEVWFEVEKRKRSGKAVVGK
jgi:hypothetical protein